MTSTYAVRLQASVTTASHPSQIDEATQTSRYSGLVTVLPEVVEVDFSEGAAILDRVARRKLGISAEDFVQRWDAGEYEQADENVIAQEVAMLLPLIRPVVDDAR